MNNISARFADQYYITDGNSLERIWLVAKRLYSEKTLNGDDMRNLAQELDAMLDNFIDYIDEND